MNLNWFAHILAHHPVIILLAVSVFSTTCLVIPFSLKSMSFPRFSDPQMGFSTRGTSISKRLTAWENLVSATKPSGQFIVNPKELLLRYNNSVNNGRPKLKRKKDKKKKIDYRKVFIADRKNQTDNRYESNWKALKNLGIPKFKPKIVPNLELDGFFCGSPDEKYAHVIMKSRNNANLFNLEQMLSICRLEYEFVDSPYYADLCLTNADTKKCCKPWSLANYVAILNNRASCLAITEEDVNSTMSLLLKCSKYYFNFELLPDCSDKHYCLVPQDCVKHDAVYNIINYLASTDFMPENATTFDAINLLETIIFLPIAGSIAILPYYHEISKLEMEYNNVEVVAINFGIKSILFDKCLITDTWLMGSGALFIFFCMWLYTKSLFLTIMTIIAIIFSLGVSYFMYMLVFELHFFPFMNLLAIVVVIGIGSDDAFIFCKIWGRVKKESSTSSISKIMSETFHHAFISLFVTTLTTSVAFLASYISSVTAIACFSIFAGTAVVANYVLMITWFPACMVIWERSCFSNTDFLKSCLMACFQRWCCSSIFTPKWNLSATSYKCESLEKMWSTKERYLLDCVINLRYIWLLLLTSIAVCGAVVILYYPKLQLPDSPEFQLFDSSHLFEQYDFTYKNHFWFQKESRNSEDGLNYQLPLRFVWGVLPTDNGDYLDPTNLGKLVLDPDFDISHPESQLWLLQFCRNLRRQPFYQPMMGPLLPNCFIETFVKSMQRDCVDPMSERDRSPCCRSATFPFNATVFDKCIVDEMADIYETPTQFLIPGVAGPKFSKDQIPTINAVIVEYDSNYSYSMSYEIMDEFYNKVESWMAEQMKTAPKTMKNGWFVSELSFYDLQRELASSTLSALALSMGLAFIVLLFSTFNILTSLYAILTITCSIFVTMAILVLLGWKLNILESVAVSTAIGLTVDFSLHYSVNYRLCPLGVIGNRIAATRYALSNMAGPSLMAAITTGAAGALMTPSVILPYIRIGIFLVTVMSVSWLYATFFLGSLLASLGPENRFGQFSYTKLLCCRFGRKTSSSERNRPVATIADTHELDSLTGKIGFRANKGLQRSGSAASRVNPNRYVFTDQSPSATSAITVIMTDDN